MKRETNVRILEICGTIGIGKSTLMAQFDESEWVKVVEPVEENPYLAPFYAELDYVEKARKAGFPVPTVTTPFLEIHMLAKRSIAIQGAIAEAERSGRSVVTDFGMPQVFAKMLYMNDIIANLHYSTFLYVCNALPKIKSKVVLLAGYQKAYERMIHRGRECEKKLELSYIEDLEKHYLAYLENNDYDFKVIECVNGLTKSQVFEEIGW